LKDANRAAQSGPQKARTAGDVPGPPAQAGRPKRPARASGLSTPPEAQPPRTRRIIGLEPEPPADTRPGQRRRSMPKGLPARKPRLRLRRPPGPRPVRPEPNRIDEAEGEKQ
jgi:hypothetical protein